MYIFCMNSNTKSICSLFDPIGHEWCQRPCQLAIISLAFFIQGNHENDGDTITYL